MVTFTAAAAQYPIDRLANWAAFEVKLTGWVTEASDRGARLAVFPEYGAMELAVLKNEQLPVSGGYDRESNLTTDPATILESKRPLPVGYWKGAGLALLLDILATVLSGGLPVHEITKKDVECAL